MNPDGSGQTRLSTPATGDVTRPTWSPDGARIAFTIAGDVWTMDSDGTDLEQVTTGADVRDLDWSPDGGARLHGGIHGIAQWSPTGTAGAR